MTLDYEIVRKLSGKTTNNLPILTAYSWLDIFIFSVFYLSLFHATKSKIYTALTYTVGTLYTYNKFPNRWIGRGGAQNWPPRSPDMNPLDYHVWGYMKTTVYGHTLSTTEELLQRILSAARSINKAAVLLLRKVTSSVVTPVRKSIQADGRHFEQFA